ncbi:hypothetical protein V6N13_141234 [Hibiscus sabdariffa]
MSATLGFSLGKQAKLSYASSNCLVANKAAWFGFALDEELKKSAACDNVKTALAAEISREALGLKQIDLMISGNQPVKAIGHICDLSLFSVVFNLPPKAEPAISGECYSKIKVLLIPVLSKGILILALPMLDAGQTPRMDSKMVEGACDRENMFYDCALA